jgi:tetratricopeptide (TPR) repeat protein
VATYLDRLAMVYYQEKRFADAQPLYERSLPIWEATLDPDDPQLAPSLDNLAVVYAAQQKFAKAEPLYHRALAIREKSTVQSMNNLALSLEGKDDNAAAERVYQRAIPLAEHIPHLPGRANVGEVSLLTKTLRNYADLLRKLDRAADAAKLEARAAGLGKTAQ